MGICLWRGMCMCKQMPRVRRGIWIPWSWRYLFFKKKRKKTEAGWWRNMSLIPTFRKQKQMDLFLCVCARTRSISAIYRTPWGQKRSDHLEMELQVVVSTLKQNSRRAGTNLNCWAMSLAPVWIILSQHTCLPLKLGKGVEWNSTSSFKQLRKRQRCEQCGEEETKWGVLERHLSTGEMCAYKNQQQQ